MPVYDFSDGRENPNQRARVICGSPDQHGSAGQADCSYCTGYGASLVVLFVYHLFFFYWMLLLVVLVWRWWWCVCVFFVCMCVCMCMCVHVCMCVGFCACTLYCLSSIWLAVFGVHLCRLASRRTMWDSWVYWPIRWPETTTSWPTLLAGHQRPPTTPT